MSDQKAVAYFRSSKPSEIPVELQRRRVQAYCKAMSYDLFSEITAEHPCTEQEAKAICRVIRTEMRVTDPLKLVVLNLHRVNPDIHVVHRVSELFSRYDITLESTERADHEILALTDDEEYDLFQTLAGTGFPAV